MVHRAERNGIVRPLPRATHSNARAATSTYRHIEAMASPPAPPNLLRRPTTLSRLSPYRRCFLELPLVVVVPRLRHSSEEQRDISRHLYIWCCILELSVVLKNKLFVWVVIKLNYLLFIFLCVWSSWFCLKCQMLSVLSVRVSFTASAETARARYILQCRQLAFYNTKKSL